MSDPAISDRPGLDRRQFVTAVGAFLAAPAVHAAPPTRGGRAFRAYALGQNVGGLTINLRRSGKSLTVDLRSELSASLAVISYKFSARSSEVWTGHRLQSITGSANENGKARQMSARRGAGGISVQGSRFSGVVPGNPASSSFFVPDLARKQVWISTQSGEPFNVRASKGRRAAFKGPFGSVMATRYRCAGDLKVPVDIFYTDSGEIVGYEARAKGITLKFIATALDHPLAALWDATA